MMTIIHLFMLLMSLSSGGIVARWDASNTAPQIGEPFQLTLTVNHAPDVTVIGWGELGGQWGDFEILSLERVRIDGDTQQQTFTMVLWKVDDFQTPDLEIRYKVLGDDRIYQLSPERLSFSVVGVIGQGEGVMLRGNSAPIQPFYIPFYAYFLAGIVLIVAGVMAYGWIQSKRQPIADNLDEPLADVWHGKEHSALKHSIGPIKYYLSRKLGYSVNSLTHDELLQQVAERRMVSPQHLERLKQLLARYDYYRFSDEQADADIVGQFREYAERWVAMAADEARQS